MGLTACPSNSEIPDDPTTTVEPGTTAEPTSEPTGTTMDEPPVALCPDAEAVDACCCFEAGTASVKNVCAAQTLCPAAEIECDDLGTCTSADEVAIDCALDALIAGEQVGALRVHYTVIMGQHTIELHLQGDRTAYVIDGEELDLNGYYKPTGRHDLRPASFFTTCRAGDLTAKADCLRDAVDGEATEVCLDSFVYDI